jgi:hypothetical protein
VTDEVLFKLAELIPVGKALLILIPPSQPLVTLTRMATKMYERSASPLRAPTPLRSPFPLREPTFIEDEKSINEEGQENPIVRRN